MPEFDHAYPWPTSEPVNSRPWLVPNVWPAPATPLPCDHGHDFHELTHLAEYKDAAGFHNNGPALYCRRCGVVRLVSTCLEARPAAGPSGPTTSQTREPLAAGRGLCPSTMSPV